MIWCLASRRSLKTKGEHFGTGSLCLHSNFYLLFFFAGAFAGNARKFRTEFLQDFPTPGTGPYFDTTVSSNVTGLVGKTVHLICKVKNLGNRTVSWCLLY